MAFNIPNRSPSIPSNRQPSSTGAAQSTGGFGNNIRSVADRNEQGFGPQPGLPTGFGGRTGPDGIWRSFSPQQPSEQGGDIQLQGPVVKQGSIAPSQPVAGIGGPLFSDQQISGATNIAAANAVVPLDFAMKPFQRPGSSASNSTVASALPAFAQGISNMAAAQQIPFNMQMANFADQAAREGSRANETLGLADLALQRDEQDLQRRLALLGPTLGLAGSFI